PPAVTSRLGDAMVRENEIWQRALTLPRMLDGLGPGNLCRLRDPNRYGRELPVATIVESGDVAPVKWLKKALGQRLLARTEFDTNVRPKIAELVNCGSVSEYVTRGNTISIRIDYSKVTVSAYLDSLGCALIDPPERENIPKVCRECDQLEYDKQVAIVNSPAYAWRQLGLVEIDGTPTPRGIVFSFFHGGEGLAGAASLVGASLSFLGFG